MLAWKYPDPGALLARRVGDVAPHDDHHDGRRQLAADAGQPARRRDRAGAITTSCCSAAPSASTPGGGPGGPSRRRGWTGPQPDDPPCPSVWGDDRPGSSPYEMAHLALAPTQVYPLFETALRGAAGRGIDEHQQLVSELWTGFAAVAAENPHAWSRTAVHRRRRSAPSSPTNRMVTFPYPKLMCANIDVDQAAALLLCSYDAARAAGRARRPARVPAVRRGRARPLLLHRAGVARRVAGDRDRRRAPRSPRPASASTTSRASTSTPASRPRSRSRCRRSGSAGPTAATTARSPSPAASGFAGGPGNNYSTHAIAAMVDACRRDPGLGRARHRARLVRDQALRRPLLHRPAGAGFVAVDPAETQRDGRRAPPARARRRGRRRGGRRGDVGGVRARRHPEPRRS